MNTYPIPCRCGDIIVVVSDKLGHYVTCLNCDIYIASGNKQTCIDTWNRAMKEEPKGRFIPCEDVEL